MTFLAFRVGADRAEIVMDTLIHSDGRPTGYQAKATPIPQLDLVVTGTGVLEAIEYWAYLLAGNILRYSDIDDLAARAPEAIRREYDRAVGPGDHGHTTIYHFGYSAGAHRYVVDRFRLREEFRCDRLEAADAVQFHPDLIPGLAALVATKEMQSDAEWVALGLLVRDDDDKHPTISERAHIGGQLVKFDMAGHSHRSITLRTIHTFVDFAEQGAQIDLTCPRRRLITSYEHRFATSD